MRDFEHLNEKPNLPPCPLTGKFSFPNRKIHSKFKRHAYKPGKVGILKPYKCPHCPYFHLTSQG